MDLLEEKRELAQIKAAAYQQRVTRYYDATVKVRKFQEEDLVLKRLLRGCTSLGPNWKGPYQVSKVLRSGAYKLIGLDEVKLSHLWNGEHLKRYYQ